MAETETTEIVSISIRPSRLAFIDWAARERGMSRSRFLSHAGLVAAGKILNEETEEEGDAQSE